MHRRALRRANSWVMMGLTGFSVLLALLPLLLILFTLVLKGASSLSWEFLTTLPAPAGELAVASPTRLSARS